MLHAEVADAGVRFGGGGRVRIGSHRGSVSVNWSRPHVHVRPRSWSVGGRVWIGSYPRYRYYRPYYYYYPTYVPSYYSATYYPVAPAPAPAVVAVAPVARPELPKFGIGLFAGGISVEDRSESSDYGILGRFRLTRGLLIEGELGKTSYEQDLRVDRRLGASLVYEFGAYNRFAPYVLAGVGVQQADVAGDFETTQNFAELGLGIRFAVTPRVHITADIRAGSRNTMSSDEMTSGATARMISPPDQDSNETEEYTRGRLSAIVYF
ncbi:MAG: outer membrane beta-barrel protein [Kofleriaceae bacterium]